MKKVSQPPTHPASLLKFAVRILHSVHHKPSQTKKYPDQILLLHRHHQHQHVHFLPYSSPSSLISCPAMAPNKLRRAFGAVKDKTSIALAKVTTTSSSLSDLEVAIIKATRHTECPPDDAHVRQILNLTKYARAYVGCCIGTITKRFNKTKNWIVALKALMLVQRLLSEGNPAFQQEIFFANTCGSHLLDRSNFRDTSGQPNAWDYSAFVRTYSLYLDKNLEFCMQDCGGGRYLAHDDHRMIMSATDMKTDIIFSRANQMMQLLERFIACRPIGGAKDNRIVHSALYPILKESFHLYDDITEMLAELVDRFMEFQVPHMVKVHDIFSRVARQYDELHAFYSWCKAVRIGRDFEYPDVERISRDKLIMMDEFIQEKAASEGTPNKQDDRLVHDGTVSPKPSPQEEPLIMKKVKQDEKIRYSSIAGGDDPSSESAAQASLPGGLDALINLDDMYQQGTTTSSQPVAASSDAVVITTEGNSIVAQDSGRTSLALPAPPATSSSVNYPYPFPALPPAAMGSPASMQIPELDNHQRLLAQQQLMLWQQQQRQQQRDGMPGPVGFAKVAQHHPYQLNPLYY